MKSHFNANDQMVTQPSQLVVNAWGKYHRRTKECKMVFEMSLQGMGREGMVPCAAVRPGSIIRNITPFLNRKFPNFHHHHRLQWIVSADSPIIVSTCY